MIGQKITYKCVRCVQEYSDKYYYSSPLQVRHEFAVFFMAYVKIHSEEVYIRPMLICLTAYTRDWMRRTTALVTLLYINIWFITHTRVKQVRLDDASSRMHYIVR